MEGCLNAYETNFLEMAVVVEFSIIPMGKGASVSRLIALAVKELEKRGVKHVTTPMCTIIEEESLEKALEYIRIAHEAVIKAGVERVITIIKVDDRRDVERSMEDKLKSLRRALEELGEA